MDTVFTAHTSHGTVLAIDVADRRPRHVPSADLNDRVIPLCLLGGGQPGLRCLPFGIDPASGNPILPREISPGGGLLLQAGQFEESGTLRSLISNRFLSAIPGGGLEADRVTPADWERFTLTEIPGLQRGTAPVAEQFFARAKASLAGSVPWLDTITALLMSGSADLNAALINAVWPLLTLDEFDRLAGQLRHDKALSARLLALFRADYYAVTGIPTLLAWLVKRETQQAGVAQRAQEPFLAQGAQERFLAPGAKARSPASGAQEGSWAARQDSAPTPWRWNEPQAASVAVSPRAPPRVIGPELDHLAKDGYDGSLSSFAHACNASLRQRVVPTKGTAIVATARSEGVYLLEWIAHHRLLGIEAIFLYTNDNDDGSDALLAALHAAGVITWTPSVLATGTSAQNKAYGHALNVSLPLLEHRWALFIDLDEFLVLNPSRYRGIADFARWHELRQTDAVGLNWVMVGSSGQLRWTDAPLTRRNTHLLAEPNAHIKVMMAPRQFIQAHPHFPFADRRRSTTFRLANGATHEYRNQPAGRYHARAFSDEPSTADACLYHYNFKSVEEFAWKVSRNRGDFPMSHEINFEGLDHVAIGSFMLQHRSTAIRQSDHISRTSPGLDDEMQRLRALPGVAMAERTVIAHFRQRLALVKSRLLSDPKLSHLGAAGEEMQALLQATIE